MSDSTTPESTFDKIKAILNTTLVGEVSGVLLDLRHPLLDTAHYRARDCLFGTNLRFPDSWSQGSEEFESIFGAYKPAAAPSIDEAEADDEVSVSAGDRITVKGVTRFWRGGDRLDDPYDKYEYWVDLRVERRDGSEVDVDGPVMFVAIDAMEPHSEYIEGIDEDLWDFVRDHFVTLEKLQIRLKRNFADTPHDRWGGLAREMEALIKAELEDRKNPDFESYWDTRELFEVGAIMGYALGKAEASRLMKPLATKSLKADETRMRATRAAAKARTKSDTAKLKAKAESMCKSDPNLSLNKCCLDLARIFNRDPSNIKRIVKPLFQQRSLPNGKLEYRPNTKGVDPLK